MSKFYEIEDGHVYVTTSTGARVECLAMGDQLMRVGTAILDPTEPTVPTYTAVSVEGGTEDFPHNEKSIQDPKTPDEDRAAWAEYLVAKADHDAKAAANESRRATLRVRFMALRATRVVGQPDLEEWAREQEEEWAIPVPDGETDRLLFYWTTEAVKTQEDGYKVFNGVMAATGLDEEVLDQVEEMFRNSLGRPNGTDAAQDTGDAEEGERGQAPGLVDDAALDAA
jgi:hypothetical protein